MTGPIYKRTEIYYAFYLEAVLGQQQSDSFTVAFLEAWLID